MVNDSGDVAIRLGTAATVFDQFMEFDLSSERIPGRIVEEFNHHTLASLLPRSRIHLLCLEDGVMSYERDQT